ncbi:MAG: hypothetical protein GC172_08455 [Phycisphaera sp.]|nr:hypothetical protein [Phycisphaera sp.]
MPPWPVASTSAAMSSLARFSSGTRMKLTESSGIQPRARSTESWLARSDGAAKRARVAAMAGIRRRRMGRLLK